MSATISKIHRQNPEILAPIAVGREYHVLPVWAEVEGDGRIVADPAQHASLEIEHVEPWLQQRHVIGSRPVCARHPALASPQDRQQLATIRTALYQAVALLQKVGHVLGPGSPWAVAGGALGKAHGEAADAARRHLFR